MPPPLLQLQNIRLTFGGTPLLEGAEFSVSEGERLCLVGRNGSGKSTLLKIAAGLVEADTGTRSIAPRATVRYLQQEPDLEGYASTLAYVEQGLAPGDDTYRATYLLSCLGLTGTESTSTLSGGEARRAALARVLAPCPDILLLDEPTNHLDLPAIEWLEGELAAMNSAVVIISHDRRFLQRLTRTTVWLDRGITRRIDQGFAAFEPWRDTVLEQEELDRHKLDRRIAMEEDWVRYGVTARRKRNQGRLARLGSLRDQRREQRRPTTTLRMDVAESEGSGSIVFEGKRISKSFQDRAVISNLSLRVMRGDRLAIVGANGTGKSTLVKIIAGSLEHDGGDTKRGTNIRMHVLDQHRHTLPPDTSIKDFLTGGSSETLSVGDTIRHFASYMKDFLFTPEQARTPLRALSGGERGRLVLAKALAVPSNLLILDEPTNDLDLETLDLLQEVLADYAGTVIVVSHDRDFVDRVATSVIWAEGDGRFVEYAGGYTDALAQRGEGVKARKLDTVRAATREPDTAPPTTSAAARRKLSFKDKHELETLPRRMEKLQVEIQKLRQELSDSSFYARDARAFATASARLEASTSEVTELEDRWLELEILKQELD